MTTPAFVQSNSSFQTTGTNPSVTIPTTPTAGNLLLAYFLSSGTIAAAPAGWAQLDTYYYGFRYGYIFSKTSNGTETSVSATISASGYASAIVEEWVGQAGTITHGGQSVVGAQTTNFGPTDAPIGATSIPNMFLGSNYAMGVLTPTAPWTGRQSTTATSGSNLAAAYYESAPNAAATLQVANSGTSTYSVQRVSIWINPTAGGGGTPLGTAASTGVGTALATLAMGVALAGSSLGIGTGNSSLAQSQALGGSAQGAGTASASITQLQALAGATNGAGISAGTLTIPSASGLALQGHSYGSGYATATIAQYAPISGTAFGARFGSAQIAQSASLSGSATGARVALASVAHSLSLTGYAIGSATASAPLGFGVSLSGSATGSGTGAGTLQTFIPTGYLPGEGFNLAITARSFYATLAPRKFYITLPARSFYRDNASMIIPFPSQIDPAETKVLTIDATADLAAGVTLTGIIGSPIITVISGTDTLASSRFSGSIINAAPIAALPPGIPITIAAGKAVQIIATTPIDGASYEVRIPCTTSDGTNTVTLKGVLSCSSK
jgi:hypothetical protein